MTRRTRLDFDISVSGAKQRASKKRGMSGAVGSGARKCEWEGCEKPGTYRAPVSRERLNEFRWFCLDHVREYNSRWNYYEDMSEDEISDSLRSDRLWGRPTWKLGQEPQHVQDARKAAAGAGANPHADGEAWKRFGFQDPLEVLGDKGTLSGDTRRSAEEARARLLPKSVRRALGVMQLDALASKKEIRIRYKELVTRYHPDQNGGDRSEEARLREVLWAWDQLKNHPAFSE